MIYNFALKNRFKAALIKHNTSTVSISLVVQSGSMYESKNGVAHLIEHLLLQCKRFQEYTDKLNYAGSTINAMTGKKYVTFKILTTNDYLNQAIEFLSFMIENAEFEKEGLEHEKKVINQEIERLQQKIPYKYLIGILEKAYSGPFSRPISGAHDTINSITLEDINKFYRDYYIPPNMALCICGDIDFKAMEMLIADKFESIPLSGTIKSKTNFISNIEKKLYIQETENSQTQICIGIKSPGIGDPLYPVSLIYKTLLCDGIDSVLYKILREEKSLIYCLNGFIDKYKEKDLSHLFIYTSAKRENVDEVILEISNNIMQIENPKINEYDFIKGINKAKMALFKENDINYKLSSFVACNILDEVEPLYPLNIIDSVKLRDINYLLDKYYNDKNFITYAIK